MKRVASFLLVFACLHFLATFELLEAQKRAITFEDFINIDAVSDPQISPDGKWVAFVVADYSLEENSGNSDLWIASISGGSARQLTRSPKGDSQPRWAPDSKRIAFVSSRDGAPQVYVIHMDGGEARRITDVKTGVSNLVWSPDGQWLAFSSGVDWPQTNEKSIELYATQVKIWDELLYRHWDEWREGKRSHLFVIPATGGAARDLTPLDRDIPTLALGGVQDIAFTPDSKQVAFVMNPDQVVAISTNNDIFVIPVEGGAMTNLTEPNPANDNNPLFSPDGRWMAYRAQMRAGFESDRHHLMLHDRRTGAAKDITPDWHLSVGEIDWSPDGRFIYAVVEEAARNRVYRISIPDGKREKVIDEGHQQSLRVTPDGAALVFTRQSARRPAEVYLYELKARQARALSQINDPLVSQLQMHSIETFRFEGARGEPVEGLLLKPPFFEPGKKYPLVYLIHGGPQGAWEDNFHARWNYQMFASPGYVVAMVNFHGSTGYGQEFTDSITQHWGDYPYEDNMKGLDYVLENYSFIDKQRIAAAGASYGGYMINWIATHSDRFVCLINHDGVFNMESMYGETEELWFPEWEFDGTPWKNRELYEKWSPHQFAENLKTPMLVIHGQLDYRVDVSQGLEAFTALRRQGVPARFVYFPDEGHWVLKPRNRRVWWGEVLGWLGKYLGQ